MKKFNFDFDCEITANLILAIAGIFIICSFVYKIFFNKTPKEFEYKKHQYIEFPNKGVVHDPACKQCQLVFD